MHPVLYFAILVALVVLFTVEVIAPASKNACDNRWLVLADTKSPRWLGYVIQRPEMHRVHHRFEHHAQNYGLPIWDMLFGTWANPKERVEVCSFDAEKTAMVCEMLRTKDVHA